PVDVHGTVAVVVSGQGHLQRGSARGGFHVHGRGGVGDLHLGGGLGPVVLCGGDGDGVLTDGGVLVRVRPAERRVGRERTYAMWIRDLSSVVCSSDLPS